VILRAEGSGGAIADFGRGKVREVEGYGEPFCYVSGLDAPEGGEGGHTFVEMRTRDHIGTKVRSF